MTEHRICAREFMGECAGWWIGGALAGAVVAGFSVHGNTSLQGGGQAWPAVAWIVLLYSTAALALGLFSAVLARVLRSTLDPRGSFAASLAAALFALPAFASMQLLIATINWRGPSNTQNLAASACFAVIAALAVRFVVARKCARLTASRVTLIASSLAVCAMIVCVWGASTQPARAVGAPPSLARSANSASPRVFVIGIDGLDWDRLRPLMESGRCPNFARLFAESYHAPLTTFEPTWSPVVWNTISTGVPMQEHGVLDFTELQIPGLERGAQRLYPKGRSPAMLPRYSGLPSFVDSLAERGALNEVAISGLHRRAKAFWNVLSEQGVEVGVVRWWASWPAEQVRGYFVSDNDPLSHALSKSKMSVKDGEIAMAHMTSPPELARELIALIEPPPGDARTSDDALDLILRDPILVDLSAEDIADLRRLRVNARWFDIIRRGDEFSTRVALHLWNQKRVSMCAVYLRAVDNISHRMWRYTGVIDRTYEFTDARLGELLAATDENATVLVVSDHGWNYEPGPTFAHSHAPPGVLMLRGPHVIPGAAATGAAAPSVFDVAPTVLALYGLPAQADARGRVWNEAFTADSPAHKARPAVESWGAYRPQWTRSEVQSDSEGRREAADLLRHLGYLD